MPFSPIVYMFCTFIFACGITHIVSIWTVWHGHYGFQGTIKAFTVAASLATAIMLYPVLPRLLSLRRPRELELANMALHYQIEQRKSGEGELIKLQGDLARLGRITTVGQMASGLAHELNQPLLVISASADAAAQVAKSSNNNPVLFECLDDIQKETQRAGEIIRALRLFVCKKSTSRKAQNLNELVDQAVQLMSNEARQANVQLKVKTGKVHEVEVDRVQIAQVLVNLIRNSVEAIASSPAIRASDGGATVAISIAHKAGRAEVTVTDNGPGLAPDIDPFEAFETNKPDGMGVGLSISRDIIESHGGTLVQNHPQRGASFTCSLPVSLTRAHSN